MKTEGGLPGVFFKLLRKPFILRPERRGEQKWDDVLTQLSYSRVGDDSWVTAFRRSLNASGAPLGIRFNFDGNVGNSFDSLRLLAWCSDRADRWAATLPDGVEGPPCPQTGVYPSLRESLAHIMSRDHFERARCVATPQHMLDSVAELVRVHGVPAHVLSVEAAEEVLATDAYAKEVHEGLLWGDRQGIHAIPVAVFRHGGKTLFDVSGAVGEEHLREELCRL